MGYLSQKKHRERENIFFTIASVLMVAISIVLLINPEFVFLGINLFHFYCLSWVLFVASLLCRKFTASLFLGSALLVCYALIAISGNIFFSDEIRGGYHIKVTYGENTEIKNAQAKGALIFGNKVFASYYLLNEEAPIMLIKVNFKDVSPEKYSNLLDNLQKFVVKQNVDTVVFGDFAMPVWAKKFRRFVEDSGLTVKNRLVFESVFDIPHFYILGFSNTGVDSIIVDKNKISAEITYDIL